MIEAYRAYKKLEEFGIKTQLASINLIIPEEQAQSLFFKKRRDMQLEYIEKIKEKFESANILTMPMFVKEIKEIDMLEQI